ncbi:unnamed protein product [Linum trigynum]|uniref:Uncharacterized protein n=1 Tax=Linum trigynum TaxID=586398 RepID=A0AAV2CFA7_9ROSI
MQRCGSAVRIWSSCCCFVDYCISEKKLATVNCNKRHLANLDKLLQKNKTSSETRRRSDDIGFGQSGEEFAGRAESRIAKVAAIAGEVFLAPTREPWGSSALTGFLDRREDDNRRLER